MTVDSGTGPAVEVRRRFAAPPDRVYAAWVDPDLARCWLSPGRTEVGSAEIDARVGGRYRIWQEDRGAPVGGFDGEILELVPSERIVLRLGFVGPERDSGPVFDSMLTVTFVHAEGGGTDLTLVHERLEGLREALPEVADSVGVGWESTFDKLQILVGG